MLDISTSHDNFNGYGQVKFTIMSESFDSPKQIAHYTIEFPYSDSMKESRLVAFQTLKTFLEQSLTQIDEEIAKLQ